MCGQQGFRRKGWASIILNNVQEINYDIYRLAQRLLWHYFRSYQVSHMPEERKQYPNIFRKTVNIQMFTENTILMSIKFLLKFDFRNNLHVYPDAKTFEVEVDVAFILSQNKCLKRSNLFLQFDMQIIKVTVSSSDGPGHCALRTCTKYCNSINSI